MLLRRSTALNLLRPVANCWQLRLTQVICSDLTLASVYDCHTVPKGRRDDFHLNDLALLVCLLRGLGSGATLLLGFYWVAEGTRLIINICV